MGHTRCGSSRATRTLALPPPSGSWHEDGLADGRARLDRSVRRGGLGEREARDERAELALGRRRERALLEVAQATGALRDARADGRRGGEAAGEQVAGGQR